ncbi:neurogenic locus Notch protein-like [Saccostrea echinata]|uniref:neurogenic locus Notch protein-like n=1 Tax=Saccostrea echinata TaxID=191078 RepID=UPI002A80A96E|nr:neurogenic locus Notch protein-like [Saccostrea echinata]
MDLIKVLLQIFALYSSTILADNCSVEPECHVFHWKEWGSCAGVCGSQSQGRERKMCCSYSVSPRTVENCLKHCNLSLNFELNQSKPCRVCENGGTLDFSSLSCKCDQHYKNICCQDLVTCQDHPCKGGNCTDTNGTFTCNCEREHKGAVCDTYSAITKPATASLGVILGFTALGVICVVTAVVTIVCCLCRPRFCSCTERDKKEENKHDRDGHTNSRVVPLL